MNVTCEKFEETAVNPRGRSSFRRRMGGLAVAAVCVMAFAGRAAKPDSVDLVPLPVPLEFTHDMDRPVPSEQQGVGGQQYKRQNRQNP